MTHDDDRFREIAEALRQGEPRAETVRTVLSWFDGQRRGSWIVSRIRAALKNAGLETTPDIWSTYLDGTLRLRLRDDSTNTAAAAPVAEVAPETPVDTSVATPGVTTPIDPTYRLARLPSANATPLAVHPEVHPEDRLELAVSHMIKQDFSQLPVSESPRALKGIISWASIARRQCLGVAITTVRDCAEPAHVLDLDTSLFAAIESIYRHDYALVRHPDNRIGGIGTTADLT
jgi:hypothetical protein